MNILLVYPPFPGDRIDHENLAVVPMGIYSLGATLREQGHEVEILDLQGLNQGGPRAKDEEVAAIRAILAERKPDILGVSILHSNRHGGILAARIAKELDPAVVTVFGGIGATCLWEHLLTHFPDIDYVVLGEGERTLSDLVRLIGEARESGGAVDPERLFGLPGLPMVTGLAFRQDGEPVTTGPAAVISDLDNLPHPAAHFAFRHLSLTRGCPGRCTFCGSPTFWGPRVRFHSAKYFLEEVELLVRRGVKFFYVSDDTFTLDRDLVVVICQRMVERGLNVNWAAISRVNLINEEVLGWMRRAGCIQISYGVESGSEAIRLALGKHFSDADVRRAFRLTTSYGIMARAYFIYGCPGETEETIQETIALMRNIRPLMVGFYVLSIFPGTALYEDFTSRTGATDDIWLSSRSDILYFETDPDLPEERVQGFRTKLHAAFYAGLPEFARSVELVDDPEFHPLHADFLSRLAMTFDQGDYSRIADIPDKAGTAEALYRRALSYAPHPRAYLGLGIMAQRSRRFDDSAAILADGAARFPEDSQISLALAVSLMNLGRFKEGLDRLLPLQESPQAWRYIAACYDAMGDKDKAAEYAARAAG